MRALIAIIAAGLLVPAANAEMLRPGMQFVCTSQQLSETFYQTSDGRITITAKGTKSIGVVEDAGPRRFVSRLFARHNQARPVDDPWFPINQGEEHEILWEITYPNGGTAPGTFLWLRPLSLKRLGSDVVQRPNLQLECRSVRATPDNERTVIDAAPAYAFRLATEDERRTVKERAAAIQAQLDSQSDRRSQQMRAEIDAERARVARFSGASLEKRLQALITLQQAAADNPTTMCRPVLNFLNGNLATIDRFYGAPGQEGQVSGMVNKTFEGYMAMSGADRCGVPAGFKIPGP